MGKATGFMEYEREKNQTTPPKDRIKNFSEFHIPISDYKRKVQAARCMNCGVPFCQSGENFGGMTSGCPLHNLVPEWNDALYNGHSKEALKRLLKTDNFPEFTGRVCPAPCEAGCTCALNGDSVTINENELSIIEEGFSNGWVIPQPPQTRSGKSVAVIGSGPSGLAVADCLNHRGHLVTVFERDNSCGGLLMYGIPNMKLEKSVIDRRIELMKAEGVTFETGIDVGVDISFDKLDNRFDAVVLCCGAKKARDLTAPGRDANGIYFAVDYLTNATKKVVGEIADFEINAKGKNVVIVGGGDTGNDCLGTAIRQGAISVTQLEIMPKPPQKRSDNNPWPQWPRVLKTDYGQEEAIAVFGHDPRIFETTVKEFIKDDKGNLKAIKTVQLDKNFKEVSGTEKTLPCELLFIAAGFIGCEDYVSDHFLIEKSKRGVIETEPDKYSVKGKIFVAGDIHRGQSLVVHAINEGRECAKEVDEFLMGYSNM
ncbi:MAG: glutamate synthase subunit beta [Eubacteriales bacterium]|nr:glutamate synthase subunit beta [Eubacteriales bacterium]